MRLISSGAVPSSSFSVARLPSISLDQDSNSSSADPPRMRSQYPYSKAGRASFSTAVTLFQKARFSTSDCSASERAMISCSSFRSGSLTKFFTTTWMPKNVFDMAPPRAPVAALAARPSAGTAEGPAPAAVDAADLPARRRRPHRHAAESRRTLLSDPAAGPQGTGGEDGGPLHRAVRGSPRDVGWRCRYRCAHRGFRKASGGPRSVPTVAVPEPEVRVRMPPVVVRARARGLRGVQIRERQHLHVDRRLGEVDEVVIEIVELAQVLLVGRHVQEVTDAERSQVLGGGELRHVPVVELAAVVGVVGEPVAVEDERGWRVRRTRGTRLQEDRPIVDGRRQGQMRRNHS